MSDKGLNVDNKVHELKIGSSFDAKSRAAVHAIRYDFKPASVDTTKDALVEVGAGHHVTLTVPHVEGSGKTHTVYKGNKRPVNKECVLIIDHETGTFTLERLSNTLQLKKTRTESANRAPAGARPLTPVDCNKQRTSPGKPKAASSSPSGPRESPNVTPKVEKDASPIGQISDSSSDSDSDLSDSDSEAEAPAVKGKPSMNTSSSGSAPKPPPSAPPIMNLISSDLRLSDTSDSDSD